MTARASAATTGRGRLTLLPGLCRLWRDETAVQLGINPTRAIVIEMPDPSAARVLDLLDGSRTEKMVFRDAAAIGVSRDITEAMLAALRAANVLIAADSLVPSSLPEGVRRRLVSEAAAIAMGSRAVDIPGVDPPVRGDEVGGVRRRVDTGAPSVGVPESTDSGEAAHTSPRPAASPVTTLPHHPTRRLAPVEAIRRRATTSVQVTGVSRLVVPIAATLARSGIGHVDPAISGRVGQYDDAIGGFVPADTNRPRGTAASEAVLRAAPFTDTRALRAGGASFVVQVGQGVPAELAAYAYARRSLAHLLIEERDDTVLVGPLVRPDGSPCLRCLDLHRRDRDPAWPTIVAQLATSTDVATTISTSTTLIAVGVATAQVLAYVDGDEPETIGASIEVGPPNSLRTRSWGPHPRCDCAYRSRGRRRARAS